MHKVGRRHGGGSYETGSPTVASRPRLRRPATGGNGAGGGTALAAVVICSGRDCDILGDPGPELALAGAVVAAGAVYTAWLVVRDINQVGDLVRPQNQELAAFSVQPTYFPESRTAGLLVTWRH